MKTPWERVPLTPSDGTFEASLEIEPGEIQITVAAASNEDLSVAGANVTRFTL